MINNNFAIESQKPKVRTGGNPIKEI